jgi:Concanavalin A-like lectin/glucanases superfamily
MSSSFWSQIRWRLGGHSGISNQIHDLVQKQIDANADVQDVTVEEILAPIITLPSKMTMTDKLFRASVRDITVGQNTLYPVDPDLSSLRFWVKNYNGGAYLDDWSCMNNTVQLNGTNQPELVWSSDDDGIGGMLPVNRLIDDQYIRVVDNLNVRIKEISATATGVSIFLRIYIQFNQNDQIFGRPGVLFSKIDTEQVDYAYAAYLHDNGSIEFLVRNGSREFSCVAPANTLVWEQIHLPDFNAENFSAIDFYTSLPGGGIIPPLIDPVPYTDLCFTFQFSNNRMQIIKNGSVLTDTNNNPEATGLVGAWRLNEGGDIGNTPDGPSSYTRTVFNSVSTGNNGLITNATWFNPPASPTTTYLNFGGSNHLVDVTSYTAIQNLSAWTVSFWYYPRATPSPDGYMVRKGTLTASSWLVYHMSTGAVRFSVWNATPTRFDITSATSAIPALNTWYHIVAKVTINAPGKIFVNNVKVTGGANVTGTVDTGSGNPMRLGGTTAATSPTGMIHDLKIFNRELPDTEVTTLFNAGHPVSTFPAWKPNPPLVPGAPGPVVNPFVSVYNVPVPVVAEQDVTRLHKLTVTSLTERYNVGQGTQQNPNTIGEDTQYYDNDPVYDSGTAVQEALSTYAQLVTTPVSAQYLTLNNSTFAGQRFLTGSDVVGKPVLKVIVDMADVNTNNTPASGNIVAKIIRDSDGVTQKTSNSIDSATIANNQGGSSTSAWTQCTFDFSPNTYVMANNDRIQFEYDQGGLSPEVLSDYSQLGATLTAGSDVVVSSTYISGQKFVTGSGVIGKPITKIVVKMADVNSSAVQATGNVVAKIYSGTTHKATSDAVDASTLADNPTVNTTSWTTKTFTFSGNTYNMVTGDRVQFEYDQGGTPPDVEAVSDYSQLGASLTANQVFGLNSGFIGGQKFVTGSGVIGKPITKVVVKMADTNPTTAPATGNIVAKIYSGTTLKATSNTVDASTLTNNQDGASTTAYSTHTFTFPSPTYNMVTGDRVQFEYDQGGAGGEVLSAFNNVGGSNTNQALCHSTGFGGQFIDNTSGNLHGKVISKVVARLSDYTGSSTGPVTCKIIQGTTGDEKASSTSIDANTIANQPSFSNHTFTFPGNAYVCSGTTQDYIAIFYNWQGAGGSQITIGFSGNTYSNTHGFAYATSSGFDHAGNALEALLDVYTGGGTQKEVGIPLVSSTAEANSNTVQAAWSAPTSFSDVTFDMAMDVYQLTTGSPKAVGIPTVASTAEANSNTVQAQWSAPTTFSDLSSDLAMDVYQTSLAGAKAVGIPYFSTNPEANSNAYDAPWSTGTITERTTFDVAADVYINAATGTPNHLYTQLQNAGNKYAAIFLASTSAGLFNQKMSRVTTRLNKVGAPTGTLFCRLKKASDGSTITFGLNNVANAGLDVSTLTTGAAPATLYSFENDAAGQPDGGYAIQSGDRIMWELSGGTSSGSAYVQIARTHTTSRIPNVHMQTSTDGSTWTPTSPGTDDVIGQVIVGGVTTPTVDPYYTLGFGNERVLQKVTSTTASAGNIYNQKITQVKVWLKRVGTPTGFITCGIRNAAGSLVSTINTFDSASVSNSAFTQYTFTNLTNAYTMALNDRISLEFTGGNSSNHIQINANLLDSYPYGALQLFDGSIYSDRPVHDLAGFMYSGGGATDPLARSRVAEYVATANSAIKLKQVSRITAYLKRTGGTLPGNVSFFIRNAAGNVVATIGTISAITVDPNNLTAYTITSSPISVYALQVGDYITIEYNDGDDFNYIDVMTTKTTDGFDGTVNTYLAKYDDVNWVPNNAIDLVGQWWEGGDTYTPSQEDVLIPPPLYTKDLTILAGGYPWTYVNHAAPSLTRASSQFYVNAVLSDCRFYRRILTVGELGNLLNNRTDVGAITFGHAAVTGFFALSET